MQAYCPVSFALKLAAVCLVLGVVLGVWLTNTVVRPPDSQPSQPTSPPLTQVADVLPGQSK